MRSRWGGSSGVGAFLTALVLSLFPYSAWCLHDRHVMIRPEIQPVVWSVLECGELQGLWNYNVEGSDDWATVYVWNFTLDMPAEGWHGLDWF